MSKYIPTGYYVYALIDPINEETFYIGKGKGRRMYAHARSARSMDEANKEKYERIDSIHRIGQEVAYKVIEEGLTEAEAFHREKETIARIGIHNLTNAIPGQNPATFKLKLRAQANLKRMRPFREWLSIRPRSGRDIEMYFLCYDFFEDMAIDGTPKRFDARQRARREGRLAHDQQAAGMASPVPN